MRDRQRLGDSDANLENFVQRHRTLTKALGESLTFEELHDQVVDAIVRADVIEMTNVRMVQRGNGPGLALHALLEFRRRRKMRSENFNRDRAVQAGIQRTVDFPHSAGAQRRLDFIGAEFRARGKGHRCCAIIASSERMDGWLLGASYEARRVEHSIIQPEVSCQAGARAALKTRTRRVFLAVSILWGSMI